MLNQLFIRGGAGPFYRKLADKLADQFSNIKAKQLAKYEFMFFRSLQNGKGLRLKEVKSSQTNEVTSQEELPQISLFLLKTNLAKSISKCSVTNQFAIFFSNALKNIHKYIEVCISIISRRCF